MIPGTLAVLRLMKELKMGGFHRKVGRLGALENFENVAWQSGPKHYGKVRPYDIR
jgi:hypothetical protein